MNETQGVAATFFVHQQCSVAMMNFGDVHQGAAQALLPSQEVFISIQVFKGAKRYIAGSAVFACAAGADGQAGQLFEQSSGWMLARDEIRQWHDMGHRPTGSQEQWVESLGKFDQRVHWERPGLGSVLH
jgi:hypothetical protein